MSWKDLLNSGSERVLPWFGFKRVHDAERSWTLLGPLPPEHGWYRFNVSGGRGAELASKELQPLDPAWGDALHKLKGYLVGDRFILDSARVDPDPSRLINQTTVVFCIEPGLERFARVTVALDREDRLVYLSQEFPLGPEAEVTKAYQDRAENINRVQGVTPPLDLAFRWLTYQRAQKEKRVEELRRLRAEEEKKRAEEERLQQLMKDAGSAVGRRALAARDFETAAREALRVSGAELLDVRQSYNRGEMVVQYRFQHRRLECVVERATLRIVDAGVCLADHDTGFKGDTMFSLESLPGVIGEAMRLGKLVVWRHGEDDDD
jgi:hypothetical protein